MQDTLLTTKGLFPVQPISTGKVRDIYDLNDMLLIIATDRISAFDVIMPNGIPDKGRVLNGLSQLWFDRLGEICHSHCLTTRVDKYPAPFRYYNDILAGRSMLVEKLNILPIECVVRGYLAGSGWKDYQQSGSVCGIKLPKNLTESEKLPHPIFTPASKAEIGQHDENLTRESGITHLSGRLNIGIDEAEMLYSDLASTSIALYRAAAEYALTRGIILADTKFEFGLSNGRIVIADEVLTPDSSRFWGLNTYEPGRAQNSFDKQFVRDWLENTGWNKEPPAPELPFEIVKRTQEKYMEAYQRLTGKSLN